MFYSNAASGVGGAPASQCCFILFIIIWSLSEQQQEAQVTRRDTQAILVLEKWKIENGKQKEVLNLQKEVLLLKEIQDASGGLTLDTTFLS